MKAKDAPEKIYLQKYDNDTLVCLNKWNIHEEWSNKPCNEKIATNIEYTRSDAFFEKAEEFLYEKLNSGDMECGDIVTFINDFKKAMRV